MPSIHNIPKESKFIVMPLRVDRGVGKVRCIWCEIPERYEIFLLNQVTYADRLDNLVVILTEATTI